MVKDVLLRCQFGGGQRKILNSLTSASTLNELQEAIFQITNVPKHIQKVMSGFPPKPLNMSCLEKTLEESNVRSGDTLIVEGEKQKSGDLLTKRKMFRKVVPADNSCLFTSLSYVLMSSEKFADDMRVIAAKCIAKDPETYSEAFLGKPNSEYCLWLTQKEHWGGAIELNVLSKYNEVEIDVADIQTGRIYAYGENEAYRKRVFLLYDGIHYDALADGESGATVQTIFDTSDVNKQIEALEIAEQAKKLRQFTDLSGFSLRCLVCNTPLVGQTQAQQHAKNTGHMNFGEV